MIRLWFALAILIAAVVATTISSRTQVRQSGSYPAPHLVALLLAFVLAMIPDEAVSPPYKGAIGFVLLLLLVRDAVAGIPGTPRAVTVGTNTVLWGTLWITFAAAAGRSLWTPAGLILLVPLGITAWLAASSRTRAGDLWTTLLPYALQIALAIGFAALLLIDRQSAWSALALLAAMTFAATDLLMARDLLHTPIPKLALWQLPLTAPGSTLLPISAWGPSLAHIPRLLGL